MSEVKKKILRGIGLELSNQCNMKHICKHCDGAVGIYDKEIKFMPRKVIEVLKKEIPLYFSSFTLSGGEVACYPELVKEIVNEIKLPFVLMANGLKVINNIQPTLVLVSIDPEDLRPGIDNEEIIKNVLSYRSNLSVNTVLSSKIDIISLYKLICKTQKRLEKRGQKITEWKLGFIIDQGLARFHRSIFPHWDIIFKKLADFLKIYFKEKPFHLAIRGILYTKNIDDFQNATKVNMSHNPCKDCFNRLIYSVVNLGGELQLCTVARNVSVKITDSLTSAMKRINSSNELNKLTYQDWQECLDCRYFQICAAGCPGLAYLYTDKWMGRDIFQCEIMKHTEKYLLDVFPENLKNLFEQGIDSGGKIY